MYEHSARVHGMGTECPESIEDEDKDDEEYTPPHESTAFPHSNSSNLSDRIDDALKAAGQLEPNRRFDVLLRVVCEGANPKGVVDRCTAGTGAGDDAATGVGASASAGTMRKLNTRGWPTTIPNGGFRSGSSGSCSASTSMSEAVAKATTAAGAATPSDGSMTIHDMAVATVFPGGGDNREWQLFMQEHCTNARCGSRNGFLYDVLNTFSRRDQTKGPPNGADYEVMAKRGAEVKRLWRALAKTSATLDDQLTIIKNPTERQRIYGRELEVLYALGHCIEVDTTAVLDGDEVSVPEGRLSLFNTPERGSGRRFFREVSTDFSDTEVCYTTHHTQQHQPRRPHNTTITTHRQPHSTHHRHAPHTHTTHHAPRTTHHAPRTTHHTTPPHATQTTHHPLHHTTVTRLRMWLR